MTVQELERLRAVEVQQVNIQKDLTEVKADVKTILNAIGEIRESFIQKSDYNISHAKVCADIDKLKRFVYMATGGLIILQFVITIAAYMIGIKK